MNNTLIEVNRNYFVSTANIQSFKVYTRTNQDTGFQLFQLKVYYTDGTSTTLVSSENEEDVRNRLNDILINGSYKIL